MKLIHVCIIIRLRTFELFQSFTVFGDVMKRKCDIFNASIVSK